jgi:hypothetical protein
MEAVEWTGHAMATARFWLEAWLGMFFKPKKHSNLGDMNQVVNDPVLLETGWSPT